MTQICPNCQQPNRAEARFCAQCRAALPGSTPLVYASPVSVTPPPADSMPCPQCGKAISTRAKFCNYCGQPLTGVPTPQTASPQGAAPLPAPLPPVSIATPQATAYTPVPQSPPPYAPPAFTPQKGLGLSRRHKIIVGVTGVAVLIGIMGGAFVVLSQPPSPASTATTTPTLVLPAIAPTPTIGVAFPATSTPMPPQPTVTSKPVSRPQDHEPIIVQPGDTLYKIAGENCKGIRPDQLERYAHQIAELNGLKDINLIPVDIKSLDLPGCP